MKKRVSAVAVASRSLVLAGRLLAICGAVAALLAIAPALAQANYVGRAYLYGDYFRGAYAQLTTHDLYAYYWPANYVKNMLWVHDPNGDFIEAGQFVGTIRLGGCDAEVGETVAAFWADWRPNSQYYCHVGGAMLEGATYGTTIYQTAKWGTTWDVGTGAYTGRSTNSLSEGTEILTGTLETHPASTTCSASGGLKYWNGNDNVVEGWHDSSHGFAKLSESQPPYTLWKGFAPDGNPDWMRDFGPNDSETCYG